VSRNPVLAFALEAPAKENGSHKRWMEVVTDTDGAVIENLPTGRSMSVMAMLRQLS
jgi:hypothetical protein